MIATLATEAAADGIDVVVVTGDRDSYQLVPDPHIKVLYNKRGVSDYALYDEANDRGAVWGSNAGAIPGAPGAPRRTRATTSPAFRASARRRPPSS